MMNKDCLECGKTFQVFPSTYNKRIFCSKACMLKAFKTNPYFADYRVKRKEIFYRKILPKLLQPEVEEKRIEHMRKAHNDPSVKARDIGNLNRSDVRGKQRVAVSKMVKIRNSLPSNPFRRRDVQVKGAIYALKKMHSGTSIEEILEHEFALRNVKVKRQFQLWNNGRLIRVADFAIPECKILIECDGDFWHANPEKYNVSLKACQQHNLQKDREKDKLSVALGWKVFRFYESEIRQNASFCVDKIVCDGEWVCS
jgi:very-short-patch-repair endonuclease